MAAFIRRELFMRRFISALIPSIVLIVLLAAPAGAGLTWCPRDPIVSLNGQVVQIWVAIPEDYQTAVTGPIEVQLTTPRGVSQEVLFTDEGFNGFGETVDFRERGRLRGDEMNVGLRVRVPYDARMVEGRDLPVLLTVILPDGSTLELEGKRGRAGMEFTIPAHP
jgi:hypothetical protein